MLVPEFAYLNGRIIPWDDAKVHVFSPVAKYGIGVFEGIRGYWNENVQQLYLFRVAEHLERYAFSQKAMRFDQRSPVISWSRHSFTYAVQMHFARPCIFG